MGLSAGPAERRAENYADGNRNTRSRKPLIIIVSAAAASVVIFGVIATSAATLNYEPTRQHVEFEITPRTP
jgi:hypothetical protein